MKKLLLILLLSSPALGAPSVVNSCIGTATSTTVSCTVNSNTGSNLFLIVGVLSNNLAAITGVTHNGDTATAISAQVDSTDGQTGLRTFYRIAPDAGTGLTVTATIGASQAVILIAVILQDVDQTTPYSNESTFDPEATSTSGTQNVTSASGNLVIDFFGLGASSVADEQTVTPGSGQTMLQNGAVTDNTRFFSSTEAGAGTVTMDHSWSPDNLSRLARAYNINAAAASGTSHLPVIISRRRR